jgi:hypothetical protein
MSQAQIQCPGCNWAFSPCSLSQHINRSQCSSCCAGSNLALNATSSDHSTGSINKSGLEHSTTQNGELPRLCGRSLANSWTTDTTDFVNNTDMPPTDAVHAAEPTEFAAAAEAPNHEDNVGAVEHEDATDPADLIDADLLEKLSCDFNCSATDRPEQHSTASEPPLVRSQSSNRAPPPPIHFEHSISDGTSQVIIDGFPIGSAGALIPGAHKGPNIYQSTQEAFGTSMWAPFHSQCDWEIAHWAKMRGPSSSAVAELFAIPGVCAWVYCLCCYEWKLEGN